MSDEENISVKIVILGEPAVGKTSLRLNFIGKGMGSSEEFLMTLGADLSQSTIQISDSITLDAQIWDIAGQENFLPIIGEYLQGAQGAILVYDMTRSYTFDKVNVWLDRLHEHNPDLDHNIPFIVLGNKADLDNFYDYDEEKVMTFIDYINRHQLYSKTDVEHLNTSAKTGYAVQQAFQRLGRTIIRNFINLGEKIEGAAELFDDVDQEQTSPLKQEQKVVEEDRIIPPSERFNTSPREPRQSQPARTSENRTSSSSSWGSGRVPSVKSSSGLPKMPERRPPSNTPPKTSTQSDIDRLVRPSELLRKRKEEEEERKRKEEQSR